MVLSLRTPRSQKICAMGSGASITIDEDESVLFAVKDVQAAQSQDFFVKKLKRNEELLHKAKKHSEVIGYKVKAPYAQPLLKAKLDSELQSLGDVNAAYCADQRRVNGSSQVYLQQLAVGGKITAMCALDDKSHMVCASSEGQIWVYNWREDHVVSQLRNSSVTLSDEDGNPEVCKIRRLQTLTQDNRLVGSADERGMVGIWDLFGSSLISESRFHEKACTGIKPDFFRQCFVTTGEDSAIILFDLAQEQVRERALPPPRSCGNGVPNTCLGLGGARFPNMLLAGGADGKLRIWDQSSTLTRVATIKIGSVTPTQCLVAPCGWQVVLTASLGDSSYSGSKPDRGGLYVYDLRMLSDNPDSKYGTLLTKFPSGVADQNDLAASCGASSMRSSMRSSKSKGSQLTASRGGSSRMAFGTGVGGMDFAMVQEGDKTLAVCLMDNVVKAFNLGEGIEVPMDNKRKTVRSVPEWEYDASAIEHDYVNASVLSAIDRYVFVGTSAPTMQIWRRPWITHRGHSDFVPPKAAPLELRSRCLPLAVNAHDMPTEVLVADPTLRPGVALSSVESCLEDDRKRVSMTLADARR
mmetsp:Transcript_30653/g.63130  ORF Transcript_30653/g.63130 Transcript_30653/m.63130 type:complete len:581 (+) Transcript_30653:3-1745(+)